MLNLPSAMLVGALVAAAPIFPGSALLDTLRDQMRAGSWEQARASSRALADEISKHAPLHIRNMSVLSAPPLGLGMYSPALEGVVRGEELFLYAEVENHGLREVAGFYELHLVSDVVVLDAQGQELAKDEAFGESHFSARTPHRQTFVSIALRVKGLSSGRYALRLILHDQISGKSAQAEIPFVMQ